MLSVARINVWSSGFVVAGLVGVALLFVSGAFLANKAKLLRNVLETIAKEGNDRPAPRLVPPRLVAMLPLVNTGIALSVVFDMVLKPVSVPIALGILGVGAALSIAGAMLQRPAAPTTLSAQARKEAA
jgi:ABC-type Fe3+-siderophore transport system permease subunit